MLDVRNAPVNVYLSAGSNIEPEANLKLACEQLETEYGELTLSSVYSNSAVGFTGDDFLNMVIGFSTTDKPALIQNHLEQLHGMANRQRQSDPFSSRTLDLDILLYGNLLQANLKVPRDDIEKYGFVLGPMAEVAPELRHPVQLKTMGELWDDFDQAAWPMQKVSIDLGVTAAVNV
jgi:2-amino-4-hydroxy-6-hydroxymethyldihydropteridine diphosphokinase